MAKNLTVTVLLDFYGELLTEKQNEALVLYYNDDCSLAEIAEIMSVSRQGARDFIKRGEALLTGFEEKLGLAGRFVKISKSIDSLIELARKNNISYEFIKPLEEIKSNL